MANTPAAPGLLSCLSGSIVRLVLEFTLPKDGSLVAFGQYALQYGPALTGLPAFMQIDPPDQQSSAGVWDADTATCDQRKPRVKGVTVTLGELERGGRVSKKRGMYGGMANSGVGGYVTREAGRGRFEKT